MPAARPTRAPQVTPLRLGSLEPGPGEELTRGADLEAVEFTDLVLAELGLRDAVLDTVRFRGLRADEADLTGTRLAEVELDRVHLPVVRAARSQWTDVRISGRAGGFEAYDARWRAVHLDGCKLDYLNLRSAELVDVLVTDCVIGELDLLDATAHRVRFERTRLSRLDVQRAELHDVDLRGAALEVVSGLLDLGGATVTADQLTLLAPLLADQLGLRVED